MFHEEDYLIQSTKQPMRNYLAFLLVTSLFLFGGCSFNKNGEKDLKDTIVEEDSEVLLDTMVNKVDTIIKRKQDPTGMNLNGKVKSVRISSHSVAEVPGVAPDPNSAGSGTIEILLNPQGNKSVENNYSSDGSLVYIISYKYDEKGYLTEKHEQNSDGTVASKSTYQFDDSGHLKVMNRYNFGGALTSKTSYKYDNKGNMIEQNTFKPDGSLSSWSTRKYDDRGNEVERIWYRADGSILSKPAIWKYNDQGDIIEGSGGYTYQFEYDEKGNWIKRTALKNGKPEVITDRVILYY